MATLQLSLEFQSKQNKKDTSDTNLPQITKKDIHQNTKNSYKSTNLEKIKNLNYALSPSRHIEHSNFIEKPNESKAEIKKQIEEFIEEFKRLIEEGKRLDKIILENDEIILENIEKYR